MPCGCGGAPYGRRMSRVMDRLLWCARVFSAGYQGGSATSSYRMLSGVSFISGKTGRIAAPM